MTVQILKYKDQKNHVQQQEHIPKEGEGHRQSENIREEPGAIPVKRQQQLA